MELNGHAHWVGKGCDEGVVVGAGGVKGVEEINEPVIYEFFQVEDELMNCSWYFSRVIPPENMNNGALVNRVVRVDYLRTGEAEEGIDGDENDADGIIMNGTSPLKIMISCDGEGWSDVSFPE